MASAADLANGLFDTLEDLGVLNLPVRIRVPRDAAELLYHSTWAGHLVVVGLNLILADGGLGRYLELEVEVEMV